MTAEEAYDKAAELIRTNADVADFVGPQPLSRIQAAEAALGGRLPASHRRFLEEFGAGNFGSIEIYGVFRDDFEQSGVPDAIWYTLSERKSSGLSDDLVVVHNPGFGPLDCVLLADAEASETAVVSVHPGGDGDRESLASSFSEFLLSLIEAEVE